MTLIEKNGRYYVDTSAKSEEPPVPGRHTLRVEDVQVKQTGSNSKNPGEPYLSMRLRITDGPDEGKAVFQNFMLNGGGRFRFEQLCQALDVANQPEFAIDNFVGGTFDAELRHEEYDGRTSARIHKIFVESDGPALIGGRDVDNAFPF